MSHRPLFSALQFLRPGQARAGTSGRRSLSHELARSVTAAVLALSLPLAGCATDDVGEGTEDLTDVANTSVKRQSIGNCWIYATVGWAESLRLAHGGEKLNLSESYLSYWHWYEQIAGGTGGSQLAFLDPGGVIGTGGWFGTAVELMLRYGVMDEGAFIPEEADAIRSDRQAAALAAINTSLKTGALATTASRKDRTLVRAEMDKAWQLKPEVVAALDSVFGKGVTKNIYKPGTLATGMRHPRDIAVGRGIVSGKDKTLTLEDAIGKPASSFDAKKRTGTFAWNEAFYPSSGTAARRDFLKRAQKALHAKQPVIMTWFVDFAAMGADKAFRAPPAAPGRQGGHMTVLEDYEVDDVPGFGTLKAGVDFTNDPKALAAALDSKATIRFFRVKNSWGGDLAPQGAADDFKGFHDLFMAYLNGPLKECNGTEPDKCAKTSTTQGLRAFVLPPAGFLSK